MKNVFNQTDVEDIITRINQLGPDSMPLWGKMSIGQMLAHCNVTYEMMYDNIHPKPGFFKRLLLKSFIKQGVVGSKPYKRNIPTAPQFKMKETKDFATEKKRLVDYVFKTLQLGASHFDQKPSHSFGKLTKEEWNNMLYKHLDHHLSQFGV